MRRVAMLLFLCLLLNGTVAVAEDPQPPCDHWLTEKYQGADPRLRLEQIEGREVFVLVPPGYDETTRRYPVVYLIHGGVTDHHAYPAVTDVIEFTAAQPPEGQAIVVMPDGTVAPTWTNWRNGALQDETLFVEHIVPFVDTNYRTIDDRAHRAISGISGGALGASLLAERHPDLFAALGTFSGLVNTDPELGITGLGAVSLVYGAGVLFGYCYRDPTKIDPWGMFGDPVFEPVWVRDGNPTELARNLGGVDVAVYSANGIPCDLEDVRSVASNAIDTGPGAPPWPYLEAGLKAHAREFSAALSDAGVPHRLEMIGCGLHTYRYFERELHLWWPVALSSFGAPPPSTFDFRDADPTFAVWGWTFEADPTRAPEFLDVTDASVAGVTLTGSGVATVVTAALFGAGQSVGLDNAVEPSVVADAAGRITFHVDLGPAHQHQQYTLPARALEALGDYWTTKTATFSAGTGS